MWYTASSFSDKELFGLPPFCVPITHIDIKICLNFQSNLPQNLVNKHALMQYLKLLPTFLLKEGFDYYEEHNNNYRKREYNKLFKKHI